MERTRYAGDCGRTGVYGFRHGLTFCLLLSGAQLAGAIATAQAQPFGCVIPDDGTSINLLVAYTPAARVAAEAALGTDIQTIIATHVAFTNTSLSNSLVGTQWNLVAVEETDYVESGCQALDKQRLDDPGDGFMDEVQVLAEQLSVDIIGLMVESCSEVTSECPLSICGIGGGQSFTWAGDITNDGLFAHESGHVLGGAHCQSYEFVQWRTIMGIAQSPDCIGGNSPENFGNPGGLAPHYSNPDVTYKGHATGDALHNNAATMAGNSFAKANIRNSPDCNCNAVPDADDIASGSSADVNGDTIPDECQCATDADCDDGVFCNGAETCNGLTMLCVDGFEPCGGAFETCDEVADVCVPTFDCGNLVCEPGEDCNSCPADCFSASAAVCGNRVCEVSDGEDCHTCPFDCQGGGSGSTAFCCGSGSARRCQDPRCNTPLVSCTTAVLESCCGDGRCGGTENNANCAVDCPSSAVN